jgi:integrase/recombinase XerD
MSSLPVVSFYRRTLPSLGILLPMHNLTKLKQEFLYHLAHERGRSEKTLENYNRYLCRFFAFAKAKKVSDLTAEQVCKFRLYLAQQPGNTIGNQTKRMKPQTQNYHLIAMRSFLKFLQARGVKTLDPKQIVLVRTVRPEIQMITEAERELLLGGPDRKTVVGMRDRAILELLFSTGLRLSELCALAVADVQHARGEVVIRDGRGRERTELLTPSALAAIAEYLDQRNDMHDALFVRYGRKMHDGNDRRISPRAVERLVGQYGVQVGIANRVTPQIIRHTFITNASNRNGADTVFE